MKRFLIVPAFIIFCLPVPAQAGWTSGAGPVAKTLDCVNPMALDNCILLDSQDSKPTKLAPSFRGGQRVYRTLLPSPILSSGSYGSSLRLQKPQRALQDSRVK